MSNPFVAEIRIFPFNFAPKGWAFCDGQILPLSQNTALFSLLGTTYGGDGKSTFALPNMQGNVPLNQGQSNTGTFYDLGEISGSANVTLLQTEMPAHTHTAQGAPGGGQPSPAAHAWGNGLKTSTGTYAPSDANNQTMSPFALGVTGSSFPHNNMQPYLTLNFCIALQGVFPPRG